MRHLSALILILSLAAQAHAASPSINLTPNRSALFMVLTYAPIAPPPRLTTPPLFQIDLTLDDAPMIRLTPRWIEERGIKVELVGEDVVVTMPFLSSPTRWVAKRFRRLAVFPRKRS